MLLRYAAVNVFPDPPHRGAAWGLPRGSPGGLLFVQAPGVWGVFSSFAPRLESRDLSILKIIDYSSHCYKIQVLILQNIKAVMFKFSWGVDMRQSYVQGDRRGCRGVSHVQGGGKWCRGASHDQSDGRGVSHVQDDCRPGGWGASAMLKVIGGVRAGRQPCSRWWEGNEGRQPCSRWWAGCEGRQPCSRW